MTSERERLKRELLEQLGLDQLSVERCIEGLFGDIGIAPYLLDLRASKRSRRGPRRRARPRWRGGPPREESEIRVVQTGGARRHDPAPDPEPEPVEERALAIRKK